MLLLKENLFDKEYIKEHTLGFEELSEHLKSFSPEVNGINMWN